MKLENSLTHSTLTGIDSDTARIRAEYQRREKEVPRDFYSLAKPSNLLMRQQTVRSCIHVLQRAGMFPLHGRRVADIGCGSGLWMLQFMQWGASPADVAGIDLMPHRVERARTLLPQADI